MSITEPYRRGLSWKQRSFSGGSYFYEGALTVDEFFLRSFSKDPTTATNKLETEFCVGRYESNMYEINDNAVTYIPGSENISGPYKPGIVNDVHYSLLREIVTFGLGNLRRGSLRWDGDRFTAIRGTNEVYGRLVERAGVPEAIELSRSKGADPFLRCEYKYSDTFDLPAVVTVHAHRGGPLMPVSEIRYLTLKIAESPVAHELFDPHQFLTKNIAFTNFYTNGNLYYIDRRGAPILMKQEPNHHPIFGTLLGSRIVALTGAICAVGIPLSFLILQKRNERKTKTQ